MTYKYKILFLLVLSIAKKIPTKTPKNNDSKVSSTVSFVALSQPWKTFNH